jgi:hypothetical protein
MGTPWLEQYVKLARLLLVEPTGIRRKFNEANNP